MINPTIGTSISANWQRHFVPLTDKGPKQAPGCLVFPTADSNVNRLKKGHENECENCKQC